MPLGKQQRIFGFRVSPDNALNIVMRLIATPRAAGAGPGLVVTPNIDHVWKLRGNADFRAAYDFAEIVTCDGFPVYHYAKLRGLDVPGRVTGTEIAALLMQDSAIASWQRLFFVVDSDETAAAVAAWVALKGIGGQADCRVCPPDFERNQAFALELAEAVRAHGTTILLMGVGAPRSEVFAWRHRAALPDCWVLCVGQALRVETGLARRAPEFWQRANLEWLWRIAAEPRRLTARYLRSAIGFSFAVVEDLFLHRDPH